VKDIKLDPITHDIVLGPDGNICFVSGFNALIQKTKIRLFFFLGEWYLDTSKGVDYFKNVYVKKPNSNLIDNMIIITILEDKEIVSLLEYNMNIDNGTRQMLLHFKASTIYNEPIDFTERYLI